MSSSSNGWIQKKSNSNSKERTSWRENKEPKTGASKGPTKRGRNSTNKQSNNKTTPNPPIVVPSSSTLAKVEAIKESGLKYLQKQQEKKERGGEGEGEGEGSSEDEDDVSIEGKHKRQTLLKTTLKNYYLSLEEKKNDDDDHERSPSQLPEFLTDSFLATTSACLICLSSIRRQQQVWSCLQCYCLFHLQCIQHWVRDGAQRYSLLSSHLFPLHEKPWPCPKCRQEYSQSQCPSVYRCFCGKVDNPVDDPWLLAHSCGEMCDKPLVPSCGHQCVSLCHPGPCPPCPKTINIKCYCGRGNPVMKRCGSKGWSCGRVCRKVLSCGQHLCESLCHEGPCEECQYKVDQACKCGKVTKERLCAQLEWQCDQVCGEMLDCGHHKCMRVCHEGNCGDCPKGGLRKCPCTKTSHTLPCTSDVPTCGDTCGKLLSCGLHKCMRLCHYGDCGQCLQRVNKQCRCKRKVKEMTCGNEFLCDSKCNNLRQCRRHACRRKCCDGQCPPCEQTCGRTLVCGHHKCSAPCHIGDCYPCSLTITLTCSCGKTKRHALCIQRQRVKPPICREPCTHAPKCHHPSRAPHRCHTGPCPPCQLNCGRVREGCGHTCNVPCHSEPRHKPKEAAPVNATIPWDQMKLILKQHEQDMRQLIVDPCPPCLDPVPQKCDGLHEIKMFPCSKLTTYKCHRSCGRILQCTNHYCQLSCHTVINPSSDNQAGEDCTSCDFDCQKPRPLGCTHSCKLPCHPEACPPCLHSVKLRCHCSTMPIVLKCHQWTSADLQTKHNLQACNNQCTKTLTCGHRCSYVCHHGPCSPVDQCTQKVTFRCNCKRMKKDLKCCQRDLRPVCNEECTRVLKEREEENARKLAEQRAAEEKRKQEERDLFLRKIEGQPRKRKQKNTQTPIVKKSFITKHSKLILAAIVAVIAAVIVLLIYTTSI